MREIGRVTYHKFGVFLIFILNHFLAIIFLIPHFSQIEGYNGK